MSKGPHPSHKTRYSDSSLYDEVCVYCGATDTLRSWGELANPCPNAPKQNNDPKLALKQVIEAWDSLPVGNHSIEAVSKWLNSQKIKDAISNAKRVLEALHTA